MAFLSLSRGDPAARSLLQRAIRARYGPRPPAIEGLRLAYTTRRRGPFGLPLRIDITEYYVGLTHWKWVETHRLLGLPLRRVAQMFNGSAYHLTIRRVSKTLDDPRIVESYRRRNWAALAAFLTPLTQPEVTLISAGERAFRAALDSHPLELVTVTLNGDDTVASVEIPRLNPRTGQDMPFIIRFEGNLQTVRDFVVPQYIVYQWDAGPERYAVTDAEVNPAIEEVEFSI